MRTSELPRYIYRWYDAAGVLLYVGVTTDPAHRAQDHRTSSWWFRWAALCDVDPPFLADMAEAERRELAVIHAEGPVFNKVGTRDARERAADYLRRVGHPVDVLDEHFPRTGRPPIPQPRSRNVQFRVTAEEGALLDAAAGGSSATNTWAREQLLALARSAVLAQRS